MTDKQRALTVLWCLDMFQLSQNIGWLELAHELGETYGSRRDNTDLDDRRGSKHGTETTV